ncbi:MAG: FHA domain-containing protein [Pirellulales bacterium]|jgi:pSer/pThr/pTyr-binding forkhead associated (FHA) protein|nr:FHA domain-containing protein [Thermoguttaceae bacterium]MDD4786471.1 FHA domain-containing protein [Pirellulales bacterium]MDI9446667.1 FHA domain-containing protein [Planctomycetota bacterium]NLY99981.1 FHA domain-containing protein [Pirellulaceae bacterium]
MKVKLIELNPLGHNRKVVLEKLPAVLGRSSSSQVLVEDQWVSRRHCQLDEVGGLLVVRDLGSRHGTYVNGMRVAEARLLPDDKLTVGLTSFVASYRGGFRAARPAGCLATDR